MSFVSKNSDLNFVLFVCSFSNKHKDRVLCRKNIKRKSLNTLNISIVTLDCSYSKSKLRNRQEIGTSEDYSTEQMSKDVDTQDLSQHHCHKKSYWGLRERSGLIVS